MSDQNLSWAAAGSFPGMPDLGAVSTTLSNGRSVMVAPVPGTRMVEVVTFAVNGDVTLLHANVGSIEAGKAVVQRRVGDLLALAPGTAPRPVR